MGTYEDRMNDIRDEQNYIASHAIDEDVTVCAYLGFDETIFSINKDVAIESSRSLEEIQTLHDDELEDFITDLLPWLVWDGFEAGGETALERVNSFSEEISRLGGCSYSFGEDGDCEAFDVEVCWIDSEKTQVAVTFRLYARDIVKIDIPVDGDNFLDLERLESDITPSSFPGYFGIDEVYV